MSEALAPPLPPRPGLLPGTAKPLWVGLILLLLMVPHWLIGDLIEEREARHRGVQREIGNAWAQPQTLVGPVLVLPYRTPAWRDASGTTVWTRGALAIPPAELRAEVELAPETRRRGLFEATVYLARAGLSGSFVLPEVTVPDAPEAELLWSEAFLVAGSTQLRPAGLAPPLSFDGRGIEPGEPDLPTGLCAPMDTLRWPLALEGRPEPGRALRFAVELEFRGSESFRILPLARRAALSIAAPWPTPSFTGPELPATSRVEAAGFRAEWVTGMRPPLVRRTIGACARDGAAWQEAVGVELQEAVPTYRMVSRASKYMLLFLALTFVTCGVFEMVAGARLHPFQYGLLGASVVLFPLLLLAVGEPLGFSAAYAVSAAAVAAQASIYTASATGRRVLGGVLAVVMAALFLFLHVVLSLEAYALLVGAVALFAALSVVMAATRRVEWGKA